MFLPGEKSDFHIRRSCFDKMCRGVKKKMQAGKVWTGESRRTADIQSENREWAQFVCGQTPTGRRVQTKDLSNTTQQKHKKQHNNGESATTALQLSKYDFTGSGQPDSSTVLFSKTCLLSTKSSTPQFNSVCVASFRCSRRTVNPPPAFSAFFYFCLF